MPSSDLQRSTVQVALVLCVTALTCAFGVHAADVPDQAGVLDQPVPEARPGQNFDVERLQREVRKEMAKLEKLDRKTLKARAKAGERAAQVALGTDYAKEATLLSFAPDAANDALADAARWYSLAASRGFPGALSLDQAGIRFYPIRIQRERRPD